MAQWFADAPSSGLSWWGEVAVLVCIAVVVLIVLVLWSRHERRRIAAQPPMEQCQLCERWFKFGMLQPRQVSGTEVWICRACAVNPNWATQMEEAGRAYLEALSGHVIPPKEPPTRG